MPSEIHIAAPTATPGIVYLLDDEAAVRDADIIATTTNSLSRVVNPEWVKEGLHLTCVRVPELEVPTKQYGPFGLPTISHRLRGFGHLPKHPFTGCTLHFELQGF